MPKRKEPKLTPAEQFKRFREAVRRAGMDDDGKQAEEAFKKLATTRKTSKPPKQES